MLKYNEVMKCFDKKTVDAPMTSELPNIIVKNANDMRNYANKAYGKYVQGDLTESEKKIVRSNVRNADSLINSMINDLKELQYSLRNLVN